MPARWQYLAGLRKPLQEAACGLSLIARIHGSRNQGVDVGVVPFTITTSDPLAKLLLPVPMTLCSTGLEVFISRGGMIRPGETMISLNWKLRQPPGHFGFLMPLNQQARNEVTILARGKIDHILDADSEHI